MADGYTSGQLCYTQRVSGLKSFIGGVKFLSRVSPGHRYASLIAPLYTAIAVRKSHDHVNWSKELYIFATFQSEQTAISSTKTIYLPRPADTLWIVTDGAV